MKRVPLDQSAAAVQKSRPRKALIDHELNLVRQVNGPL
jgi:hypothetical protein